MSEIHGFYKMVLWGIFIFNLLCVVGCNTVREISIEVLIPAEVTIPEYTRSVTFVNRSYPPWLAKNSADTINRPVKELRILDTIINNKFFLGVFDALNSSPLFNLEESAAIQLRRNDSILFPEPLSGEEIRIISDTVFADALICLEGYQVKDTAFALDSWDLSWDNKDYYYQDVGVAFFIEGTILWRIYDVLYGLIIDEFKTTDIMDWKAYGERDGDIEGPMNELPEVVDAYREFAYQNGYDLGMRISPLWSKVRRFYFITGSQNIKKAAVLVNEGKWEEAAVLWKKETDSTNPKIAAKTRFNMALFCEQKDLIIPAIDWATKSYEMIPEKYTKTYISILENRKLNKLKLQEQIPVE